MLPMELTCTVEGHWQGKEDTNTISDKYLNYKYKR